jgi:hypothetical protein
MRRLAPPASILWFEYFFYAAFILRLVNAYLSRAGTMVRLELLAMTLSWPATIAVFALGFLLPLAGAWLTRYRANRIAAWLLLILMVLTILGFVANIVLRRFALGPVTMIGICTCVLYLACAVALMAPRSRKWLAKRPSTADLVDDFA